MFASLVAFLTKEDPVKKNRKVRYRAKGPPRLTFYITFKSNNSFANNYMIVKARDRNAAKYNHRKNYGGSFADYGFCHTEEEFLAKDWSETKTEVKLGTDMRKFYTKE